MLTQFRLQLTPAKRAQPRPEWAYRLYAALLERAPQTFSDSVHDGSITPVSQFLRIDGYQLTWVVSLLGEDAETALSPVLEGTDHYTIKNGVFTVAGRQVRRIAEPDELFQRAALTSMPRRLCFRTPTAFKSQGNYVILPTMRLLVRNLAGKWNGCFAASCPIDDTDGQGLDTLAAGLHCVDFRLHGSSYPLKAGVVPGFVGTMSVENRLTGFHHQLMDVLLLFAGFSGIGIKTTLGMGGVELL